MTQVCCEHKNMPSKPNWAPLVEFQRHQSARCSRARRELVDRLDDPPRVNNARMAAERHLDGNAKLLDGVQHNLATGKQFRGNRPTAPIRCRALASAELRRVAHVLEIGRACAGPTPWQATWKSTRATASERRSRS